MSVRKCATCGADYEFGDFGRPPKYCPAHRKKSGPADGRDTEGNKRRAKAKAARLQLVRAHPPAPVIPPELEEADPEEIIRLGRVLLLRGLRTFEASMHELAARDQPHALRALAQTIELQQKHPLTVAAEILYDALGPDGQPMPDPLAVPQPGVAAKP